MIQTQEEIQNEIESRVKETHQYCWSCLLSARNWIGELLKTIKSMDDTILKLGPGPTQYMEKQLNLLQSYRDDAKKILISSGNQRSCTRKLLQRLTNEG